MPAAKIINLQNENNAADDMPAAVLTGLRDPDAKHLPTMLLYDERGLSLYDDITKHVPEYYLFGAEEQILVDKSDEIVAAMHSGTAGLFDGEVVLELGAGALRKTAHILAGLSRLVKEQRQEAPITYYALDLEQRELQRTLAEIAISDVGKGLEGKVETRGLCATYEQGLKYAESGALHRSRPVSLDLPATYLRDESPNSRDESPMSRGSASDSSDAAGTSPPSTPDSTPPPLHLIFLGSSLGNFSRAAGAAFLRSLPLRAGSGDTLLMGMDHDNDKALIEEAYNDGRGYTRRFILNGLRGAGRALGDEDLFREEDWEYVNAYDVDRRRHEAFFKAKRPHTVVVPSSKEEFSFAQGELVKIEESYKFSDVDAYTLFTEGGLRSIHRWMDDTGRYSLWLLERPRFLFPLLTSPSPSKSPFGVPALEDWATLWAAWDCITRAMIPPAMLLSKPIDLRHICLFYLGHIPTFLDIHLARLLSEPHTPPEVFREIFERGIDPDVDDPAVCHPHSVVPSKEEEWPALSAILLFQTRVRARVQGLYADIASGKRKLTRKMGRVLFMTFEHEAMHAETLLYMLLQASGTRPPPGFAPPLWGALAEAWDAAPTPAEGSVVLGPTTVVLGHDDPEAADDGAVDVAAHEYGWDNEHPKRAVHVPPFRISWRPVTNGEFYEFYLDSQKDKDGEGEGVPLPGSWVQIDGEVRVRTLYGPVPMKIARHWPVLTSHSSLSKYVSVKGGRLPSEAELRVFMDKYEAGYGGGANWGWRNWHPVPATTGLAQNGGRGGNGGVWEWTSTVFDAQEGFVPSVLYPGYSADFFDGVHRVVLGGSYATIPRIAERRSVRNWYHHKYAYAWISGRVVYDVEESQKN